MVPVSARVTARRNRLFCAGRALLLTGLLFAGIPDSAQAQYFDIATAPDVFDDQSTSGVVFLGKKDGLLGPYNDTNYFGPYLHLRHIAGDGPGYRDNGFTSLGLFAPHEFFGGMLFTEGRLSVNDFGNMLVSAGSGYRCFCEPWNRMFGASFWYDIDGGHDGTFTQIAANLETRGENWDLFANFYLPVAEDDKVFDSFTVPSGLPPQLQYADHNLVLNFQDILVQQFESAMKGVDVEFGGPLPVIGQWGFRGYGGWYHYEKDGVTDVDGGRFRMQADLTDAVTGQVMVTHDNQFDTSVIFGITWTIPGSGVNRGRTRMPPGLIRSSRGVVRAQSPHDDGSGGYCSFTESQWYRMFQTVNRSDRVFVIEHREQSLVDNLFLVTDELTGLPLEIYHVDSTAAPGGDGTFEMPFDTLAATEAGTPPGVFILAHAGSVFGDSIALKTNQRFVGEGANVTINTQQFGMIPLPPTNGGGLLPRIVGAPGDAITLASGTEVAGFGIENTMGAAILADNLSGTANVKETTIIGGLTGVEIRNMTTASVTFEDTVSIADTTGTAFLLDASAPQVAFDGNINETNAAGRLIDIDDLQAGGAVNFNGMVSESGGMGPGIRVVDSEGDVTADDADLTISAGDGVFLMDNTGTYQFNNLDITTMAGGGLIAQSSGTVLSGAGNIDATGGPAIFINPTTTNLRFNNVSSTDSTMMGGNGVFLDQASGALNIIGTLTIDNSTGAGLDILDSSIVVNVADVDIHDTGGSAVSLRETMAGALTSSLTVDGGLVERTDDGNATFLIDGGAPIVAFNADINHGVAVVNNDALVDVSDTTGGAVTFDMGTLTAMDGTGIQISNVTNNVSFNGTNTLDGGDAGVDILMGSIGTFTFSNNSSITDPSGDAFFLMDSAPQVFYNGTIDQGTAGSRAVSIDNLQVGGRAEFNDSVAATGMSTGVRIIDSEGNVDFVDYNNGMLPTGPLMNTSVTLMNNTGVTRFQSLDVRTEGDGNLGIDADDGGVLQVDTGMVASDGETAISLRGGTNISTVNLTNVTADNTGGVVDPFNGVELVDVGSGGTFTIDDGMAGTTDDLRVTTTAGGDGFRATNSETTVFVSSADIDSTGGGEGINLDGGDGTFTFDNVAIDMTMSGGANTGNGILIANTTGSIAFGLVDVDDTSGGDGVRIDSVDGTVMFGDGDNTTTMDLVINDTGGGDGIEILNTAMNSVISFSSVDIGTVGTMIGTGGGHGVLIGNGGVAGMGVAGTVVFNDSNSTTNTDLDIDDTDGGDGIHIEETMDTAMLSFSSVDVSDTSLGAMMGDGIEVSNMASGTITFSDFNPATGNDVKLTMTGGGHGINIDGTSGMLDLTFASVDIDDTDGGNGVNIDSADGTITFSDGDNTTPVDLDIFDNGVGGNGIDIAGTSATASITFSGVSVDTTTIGVNIDSVLGDIDFGDTSVDTTTGAAGINVMDIDMASDVTFASTTLTNLAMDGVTLTDNEGNFVTNGGSITLGAGATGVLASNMSTGGDVTVDGLTFNGGAAAIDITSSGTASFEVLINNNTIGDVTGPTDGVLLTTTDTATLNATVTANDVTDGGGDGFIATAAMNTTMRLNIGTNMAAGTGGMAGLENEFSADYVFDNDGTMELGVTGTVTAIGNPIPDADIDDELNAFGNTTGGLGTSVNKLGANQLDAVNPNTILPP